MSKWILFFSSLLSYSAYADITIKDFPTQVTANNVDEVGELLDQWVLIENNNLGKIYMLPNSITKDERDNVTVWLKGEHTNSVKGIKTFKLRYVFDCSIQKQSISHFIDYDNNGNVIRNKEIPSYLLIMHSTDPDGFSYSLMRTLCESLR